jgi:hypothetical protein
MRIFDWLSELCRNIVDSIGSIFGSKKRRGGSSDGPPENGSGVPRRPRRPLRGASAAQPIPEPVRESCDLVGGRR